MTEPTPQAKLQPRRSALYMPAANARALEKAKTVPADALILDLEDSVAPEAKDDARTKAVAAAASGDYGTRPVTIRTNGLDTPWGAADLAAAATSGAAAVVVPKVNSVAELDDISERLTAAGAPSELTIWAMVETPTAIFDARALAAHHRVEALIIGTNDLAKELRASPGPDRAALTPYLTTALLAAREAGKIILDGVYNDINNTDGLTDECRQGRQLGFDGKTLIHPAQVPVANDAWAPSEDEVERAKRIIAAFAEAQTQGRGVITVDGQMIENLHVDEARRTVATAEAIGRIIDEGASRS